MKQKFEIIIDGKHILSSYYIYSLLIMAMPVKYIEVKEIKEGDKTYDIYSPVDINFVVMFFYGMFFSFN